MVVLFSVFWRTSILFFIVTAPIYVTTNSVQEFPFLHGLTNTCFLPFWYCPFQWMWSDISSLWFTFPWWVVMLSIFSCACRPSVCLLWKMWIQTFCPFLIRLLIGLFTYLYILLLCIRYVICRFFFDSVGCLFILLMLSFAVQKPFIWSSPTSLFLLLLLIFIFMYQKLRIWNSGQGLPFTKECCFFY